MNEIADPTMSYEGLVEAGRAAREQADNMQWIEGDLALQVEALPSDERPRDPETGEFIAWDSALKRYAEDVGVAHNTLIQYRRTAEAWPTGIRIPVVPWIVHRLLRDQDDRVELIREGMSANDARRIVRARTAATSGKPGWLELMGMAADKMIAAGKDLAKLEAALEANGDNSDITPRMVEKAERYQSIAMDLAERFEVIAHARDEAAA